MRESRPRVARETFVPLRQYTPGVRSAKGSVDEKRRDPPAFSRRLCIGGRSQRDGRLCGERQEREGLLQIEPDCIIGMAQVAD